MLSERTKSCNCGGSSIGIIICELNRRFLATSIKIFFKLYCLLIRSATDLLISASGYYNPYPKKSLKSNKNDNSMLKEAADMIDDLKVDFYDEESFSISDTMVRGNVALHSNINSPTRESSGNAFEPRIAKENSFAGNLTLGLMRSSSFEFPLENMPNNENRYSNNRDAADFFVPSFREPNFPEFKEFEAPRADSNISNRGSGRAENYTGKFSPNEENKLSELELSFEETENKRTTRYSDLRKQKAQKISSIKQNKKRNVKRKPKKNNRKNNIRDSKKECKNIAKNYGKAIANVFSESARSQLFGNNS